MTELPKHSTNNNVEIEVDPTANSNQADMLGVVTQLINTNFNMMKDLFEKQICIPKQLNYFLTADLCRIYNVSESTIYNYRKSVRLPYCSDGQKVWFTQEHIDEFNWLNDSRNKQSKARKMA